MVVLIWTRKNVKLEALIQSSKLFTKLCYSDRFTYTNVSLTTEQARKSGKESSYLGNGLTEQQPRKDFALCTKNGWLRRKLASCCSHCKTKLQIETNAISFHSPAEYVKKDMKYPSCFNYMDNPKIKNRRNKNYK